jgi:hypothetical protein
MQQRIQANNSTNAAATRRRAAEVAEREEVDESD